MAVPSTDSSLISVLPLDNDAFLKLQMNDALVRIEFDSDITGLIYCYEITVALDRCML